MVANDIDHSAEPRQASAIPSPVQTGPSPLAAAQAPVICTHDGHGGSSEQVRIAPPIQAPRLIPVATICEETKTVKMTLATESEATIDGKIMKCDVFMPYDRAAMILHSSSYQRGSDFVITIEATIQPSEDGTFAWPSQSLDALSEGFRQLRFAGEDRHFSKLIVNLPTMLPFSEPPSSDVRVKWAYCLPTALDLTWTSHPKHLPLMFGDKTYPLAKLTLHCNISVEQCAYILRQFSATLEEFEAHSLMHNTLPMEHDNTTEIEMVALQKLTLTTAFSPVDLLNNCAFPVLSEFKVHPYRSTRLTLDWSEFISIPWTTLHHTQTNIKAPKSEELMTWSGKALKSRAV